MRKTGIEVVGDMPWGTHFCLFYESKEDLLDPLVSYCKAGLENQEFCLWVVAAPLTVEIARQALKQGIPEFERYLLDGSIEIIAAHDWYLQDGTFDLNRVIAGWNEKLRSASARGYVGIRVTGDTGWLEKKDWKDFSEYEDSLNAGIANQHLAVLCTYPISACGAAEILDVVRTHQFAVARRHGGWEVVETAGHKQAKAEIERLKDDLEQRVLERTSQLTAMNKELRKEVCQRQSAEEALRRTQAKLIAAHEEERTRIARELHDDINQRLALLAVELSNLKNEVPASGASTKHPLDDVHQQVSDLGKDVQALSHSLHSSKMEYLGLAAAASSFCKEFSARHNVEVVFHHHNIPQNLPSKISVSLFRVLQEALQNAMKYSGVRQFEATLEGALNEIHLRVHDSGAGFDPESAMNGHGLGLTSMTERLKLVDGQLSIDSKPKSGTTIHARVPLNSPPPPKNRRVEEGGRRDSRHEDDRLAAQNCPHQPGRSSINGVRDGAELRHLPPVHLDFGGSRTTMRNVAIGPKKRDTIHQFKPLLPFVCARPAFMRERVDQPTAYSLVSRIIIRLLEASGRQPESLAIRNDAHSKRPVLITPGIKQKRKISQG
jgi:signal transduction histidine kinase